MLRLRKIALLLILAVLVVTALPINQSAPIVLAQTVNPIKLGGVNVQAYCNAQGHNAALTNSNKDWACVKKSDGSLVFVLGQSDYDTLCRATYGQTGAFALKQGNDPNPAYNWGCYIYPATYDVVNDPNPTQRIGGFSVEAFCNDRGRKAALVNDGNDWGCQNHFSQRVDLVLTESDYNQICRETYHFNAFARKDGSGSPGAYNWSCYEYSAPDFNAGPDYSDSSSSLTPLGFLAARPGYEVNVRAAPDLEAQKLGRINAASSYPYYGRAEEWYIINFYGQRGYVAAIWVQLKPYYCC
jgi:Bacterial SH3 domain